MILETPLRICRALFGTAMSFIARSRHAYIKILEDVPEKEARRVSPKSTGASRARFVPPPPRTVVAWIRGYLVYSIHVNNIPC